MPELRVALIQQPLVWHDRAANRAQELAEPAGGPTTGWLTGLAARLDAYREKFPAHLDADRFTLEL
jgi:hypothetical protein